MIGFTELQRNCLELIGISLPLIEDYCQHLLPAVALSRQLVKIPTDGDFAASLGISSTITLLVKLFPVSKLNLSSHILWPLLIIHFIVSPSSDKRASCMLCHLSSRHFGICLLGLRISLNLGVGASTVGLSIPGVQRWIAIWSVGHTPPIATQNVVCLIYRESFLLAPLQPGVYLSFSSGFSPAATLCMPGVGPAKCRTSHFIDICNIFCYPCFQLYQGPACVRLCFSVCQPLLIS